ncbi:MAG: hypothetical protein EOP11_12815 [Proteobacteria bacterium]|nr:MAG: hypothetical protein EOP11_12815 [Pseudomonadota bacterium]
MDHNKVIRIAIVLSLISMFSFGAYKVSDAFRTPPPVAMNNDPVDFSEPASRVIKGKRLPASAASISPSGKPAGGGRSYGGGGDSGGGGSNYESPRTDASSGGGGSFFGGESQEFVPMENAAATTQSSGGSSGDSASSDRAPASTDSNANGGTSTSGIFGGLGSLLGGGSTSGSTSSSSGGGGGGGTPIPAGPSIPAPAGISAGTTGGGAFVGSTLGGYKASVSIGVPLSEVSGATASMNYKYQVNLSGQQSQ